MDDYKLVDTGYIEKFVGLDYIKEKARRKYGANAKVKRVRTDTKGLIAYEIWVKEEAV